MTSPHLPASISAWLQARMDGLPRKPLVDAQARMSTLYRENGHSRDAVPDPAAALTYAVARMPATFAACVRSFDLVAAQTPAFAPSSLLDLGAGTGSASVAAHLVWPSLSRIHMIEPNSGLAALATNIVPDATALPTTHTAVDLLHSSANLPRADIVTLSYVLAEQTSESIAGLVARAAAVTDGLLIVVEPGTPAGYQRVLATRTAMLAHGLDILAPCPHAAACPLIGHDWCHFSVRLQRTAAHRALKDADAPFEDERFSFVVGVRPGLGTPAVARLIGQADIEKGFADLRLCTGTGVEQRRVLRRDKLNYKRAKSLVWGDAV